MPSRLRVASLLALSLTLSLGASLGGASGCKSGEPGSTRAPDEGTAEPDGAGEQGDSLDPGAVAGTVGPDLSGEREGPRVRERPPAPKTRDAALVAVAHGDPEGARDFLVAHVESQPDDHEAGLALARALRLLGQLDAAEATLAAVAKASSDAAVDAETLRQRARLRLTRGDVAGAEALLRDARKLAPDDLLLTGEMVRLLTLSGRRDQPQTRQLIDRLYAAYADGTAQSAADLLGTAYAGLAERAFQSTNRVLQEAEQASPPSSGDALADEISLQLAALFLEKYKPEEAAETLGLILARDPWNPEALAGMGWALLDRFQLAGASRAAEEALQVDPGQPDAHAILAQIALIEGRREQARERVLEHVVPVNPRHQGGQIVLAALAIYDRNDAAYQAARDAVFAFNPEDGLFYADLSDLLGYLHLYPEADTVLREGVERLPDDPYVQASFGLSQLRLGQEASGREALERAWKKDRYNARTRNVRELYSDRIEPHYSEQVHRDLTVRLPTELQTLLAPGLVRAIQDARTGLDAAYGIQISPLRIEIYADPEEFSVRTVGVPSLGAVGVCFGPVITSIGPYAGTHNFDQVIWHEIAHSYAIELSAGRVPRWFTEGLSEWESEVADPSWARESAALLDQARRQGKLRKLSELELAFLRAESPLMMEVAYSTAAWALRYLGETYGRPKIIEVLKGYAAGKSTAELFRSEFGKDLATIEAEFEAWFDAQLDAKLSGWRPAGRDDPRAAKLMKALEAAGSGQTEAATKQLEALIADGADGFQVRMALGALARLRDDDKAAAKHFERAATFDRESTEPFAALAGLARARGDLPAEVDQLEKALAIDAMSLDPVLRMLVLTVALGDKRLQAAVERANAIAPLHPTVAAASALLNHQQKGDAARSKALLDEAMRTALRPDATLDVVVTAALAAEAIGDPRVADLAPRALESKELPKRARKLLDAHAAP